MMDYQRIWRGVRRRLGWLMKGCPKTPPILEMIWPVALKTQPPVVTVADEYVMRQYTPLDQEKYAHLMLASGMEVPSFQYWNQHILPDGFYVIEYPQTGALVAACFASHHPTVKHERAGNFGWLAVDPKHRGRHLGQAVSAAVTARLIQAGYQNMYLETHDFRLAAIKIYLSMGWVPFLYCEEMQGRWKAICDKTQWPYTPEQWTVK